MALIKHLWQLAFIRHAWFFFISLFYFFGAALVTDYYADHTNDIQKAKQQDTIRKELYLAKSNIEAALYKDIFLTESIASKVAFSTDSPTHVWQKFIEKLVAQSANIRHVGVAPNNIVTMMYPLEGNEAALGLDFKTNKAQFRTVELARIREGVFIAGPLELVQGGQALIARYPVFKDYPDNNQYWGTISVVIDYPKLIESTGIASIPGIDIAMRGVDGEGARGQVFLGEKSLFEKPDISLDVVIPNGVWQIAAQFKVGFNQQWAGQYSTQAAYLVFAFVVYLSFFFLYRAYIIARDAALHDELTNLPNRRYAFATLKGLVEKNHSSHFALLNLDLNGFKKVNDNYGHEAGDQLLKHVASLLSLTVRNSDLVARMGGDEFIIILNRLNDENQIEEIIEKLHDVIKRNPMSWHGNHITTSISVGYVLYDSKVHRSIQSVLHAADKNMYNNKRIFKLVK